VRPSMPHALTTHCDGKKYTDGSARSRRQTDRIRGAQQDRGTERAFGRGGDLSFDGNFRLHCVFLLQDNNKPLWEAEAVKRSGTHVR
jgi:hypothetical protein